MPVKKHRYGDETDQSCCCASGCDTPLLSAPIADRTNWTLARLSRWHAAAPLPAPRQEIYAATREGLIYTAGGLSEEAQTVLDDFVVYDPEADKWRELPPLPEARHHITLSVADGRLYAVGGFTGGFPDWKVSDVLRPRRIL